MADLGHEMYKMSLEYFVISDGKEAIKNYQDHVKRTQVPMEEDLSGQREIN